MSAAARLRALLEPLRIYSFAPGTLSAAELSAAGAALDDFLARLLLLERETSPLTAESEGLSLWEDALGHTPPAGLDARRRAVLVQLASDGSMSLDALARTLEICGLAVSITENAADREMIEINFPGVAGIPDGFDSMRATIEELLPCHLEPFYDFNYITWTLFERCFPTWSTLDASGLSWRELELIIE